MTLWVNGSLVDPEAPVLRADDHGITVGDGVFETMKVNGGKPFALTRHLRRLGTSAAGLGIEIDFDLVHQGVSQVLAAESLDPVRLRITVTGGPSPFGSDRGSAAPTLIVATAPLSSWPATADVAIVPWTRNERAATAGMKTTSYADNVVALRYAHRRNAAEAILAVREEMALSVDDVARRRMPLSLLVADGPWRGQLEALIAGESAS